jgi:hypothetical protein
MLGRSASDLRARLTAISVRTIEKSPAILLALKADRIGPSEIKISPLFGPR